ncbi:MAG: hypothetical protein ACR2RA_24900 [Geminicoccaceae bacterium]
MPAGNIDDRASVEDTLNDASSGIGALTAGRIVVTAMGVIARQALARR